MGITFLMTLTLALVAQFGFHTPTGERRGGAISPMTSPEKETTVVGSPPAETTTVATSGVVTWPRHAPEAQTTGVRTPDEDVVC